MLSHAGHVVRRDLLDGRRAVGGEHRERAALVALAVLPADQALGLHPVDLVGEPAAGLRGPLGELGHPHAAKGRLGKLDEDLIVVHGQPERVQIPVELAHQQLGQADVRAPGALLLLGEPARRGGSRNTVGQGLRRHRSNLPVALGAGHQAAGPGGVAPRAMRVR